MRRKGSLIFFTLSTLAALQGCGQGHDQSVPGKASSYNADDILPFSRRALKICSPLKIPETSLSSILNPFERSALILALSISGSFEGSDGWANLANNFDGQGLSLGLLNQNLGTGSLQPLLIRMRDNHRDVLQTIFSREDFFSLEEMLARWQMDASTTKKDLIYSTLDQGPTMEFADPSVSVFQSANVRSVDWAENTVYASPGVFKTSFKTSLKNLALNKNFVLQQIKAALSIHDKAIRLMKNLGFNSLRAYLFFFDIITQNGGLYPQNETDFKREYAARLRAKESQKLQFLLLSRLTDVRAQYRDDVRARKTALLQGHGIVHGHDVNLEAKYCYRGGQAFFTPVTSSHP